MKTVSVPVISFRSTAGARYPIRLDNTSRQEIVNASFPEGMRLFF